MTARARELEAHEVLRDAIRRCALAQYDRRAEADPDDVDPEVRAGLEQYVLVDYVVATSFDGFESDHTLSVSLRTDGKCASYRTLGLLRQAERDTA